MCDPMSIIGLGASVGLAAMQASQQQELMNKQNAANDAWIAYQRRQSVAETARQEDLRRKADAAREGSLGDLTAGKQQGAQVAEQARLEKSLTPEDLANMAAGNQQSLNDRLLSGQQGGDPGVQAKIKGQLAKAAQDARSRIAALAAVQSYGGSQFGLTNRANTILNTSGQNIRLAGDERQGSLGAYGVEKAVEPLHYQATPSGWGAAANVVGAATGARLGNQMAGLFSAPRLSAVANFGSV
jgi:hypothetical protein